MCGWGVKHWPAGSKSWKESTHRWLFELLTSGSDAGDGQQFQCWRPGYVCQHTYSKQTVYFMLKWWFFRIIVFWRMIESACWTKCGLDELVQMGNGNLRKRNKQGLAVGSKLLPLFMPRRKERPSWFLYLILSNSRMSFAIGKSLLLISPVSLLDRFLRTIGRTR